MDSETDHIILLAIELTTQLNYGSAQSRRYLEEAKLKAKDKKK